MKRSIKQSTYVHRSSILLAAVVGTTALNATAFGIARDWMTSSGLWNTSGNWSPSGAPGGLDSALIGSTATAQNGTVTLNTNSTIAALTMTDGMTLDTNTFALTVGTTTALSGANTTGSTTFATTLRVENGVGTHDLRTDDLQVTNNARVDLVGGGILRVDGFAIFDGTTRLAGDGIVNLHGTGSSAFQMDGVLAPGLDGMTINQVGAARIDLDGGIGGDRTIAVNTAALNGSAFASLTVNGDQLFDVFDDSIAIGANNNVNMNLTNGWTLGSGAKLSFSNNLLFPGAAKLNGSTVTLNGDLELGAAAHAQINAPAIINATMGTSVPTGGTLEFNNHTTLNGASITISQGAQLRFDGTTIVNGGTINTFSGNSADGAAAFNGPTTFNGAITINGVGIQAGDVNSDGATINAMRFDMDGPFGNPVWTLTGHLAINANAIDTDALNTFDGTIIVSPQGVLDFASLTVNLPAGESWRSNGTLILNGPSFGILGDSLNGSPVKLAGFTAVNANNAINAKVEFRQFGSTTISTSSYLALNGGTMADPNTITGGVIEGAGTLLLDGPKALVGQGTITAGIDLRNGAELRAQGGTLSIEGNRIANGIIGTADPTGILNFSSSWATDAADKLDLKGGMVRGAAVANQGLVSGHGTFANQSITNNKTMSAAGGTLVIDTSSNFDMDGVLGGVPVVNAIEGNLHVKTPLADSFEGIANVGFGRRMTFENGFTLGNAGTLNLSGSFAQPAVIDGGGFHILFGRVNVASNAQLDHLTGFLAGSYVSIPTALDRLTLNEGAVVDPASTIFGEGQLYNAPNSTLLQGSNSFIGVFVNNAGRMIPAGDGTIGLTTIKTFANLDGGTFAVDMGGTNAGTSFDRLNVVTGASVDGTLELNQRGGYVPNYNFAHEILHANGSGLSGVFDVIQNLAITPTKYWAVTYGTNGVFAIAALPGDANIDGVVNINDFAIMASNFNTTGTWVNGSFDGNTLINISDFALLAGNFNVSIPAELPRGAAVPEPTAMLGLATISIARRRRR